MNDEELREVETYLRNAAADAGLGWILQQADESMAEGRPTFGESSPTTVRRQSTSRQDRFPVPRPPEEELDVTRAPRTTDSGGSAQAAPAKTTPTSHPLSARERVDVLIGALERLLVDLPKVHDATLNELESGVEIGLPHVARISFVPDADALAQTVTTIGHDAVPDSAGLPASLLMQLREVVES